MLDRMIQMSLARCAPRDSSSSRDSTPPTCPTTSHAHPDHAPSPDDHAHLVTYQSTGQWQCDVESMYESHMRPLQTGSMEIQSHRYLKESQHTGVPPTANQMYRIAEEVSSLPSALPVGFSSSVFVRTDDSNMIIMTALITGPSDTPYSGGCFEFDIYFPHGYPSVPPRVHFKTTGGGAVRFNPNLYNDGKVCLSLLGTWQGQEGEKWNATSTILQVLVSIQSLILVAEPYFNEPGYEASMHTKHGKRASREYNDSARLNNLRIAVLNQLRMPADGYRDVINLHFYLKRDALLKEYEGWVSSAEAWSRQTQAAGNPPQGPPRSNFNAQKNYNDLKAALEEVRTALNKLRLNLPKPLPEGEGAAPGEGGEEVPPKPPMDCDSDAEDEAMDCGPAAQDVQNVPGPVKVVENGPGPAEGLQNGEGPVDNGEGHVPGPGGDAPSNSGAD